MSHLKIFKILLKFKSCKQKISKLYEKRSFLLKICAFEAKTGSKTLFLQFALCFLMCLNILANAPSLACVLPFTFFQEVLVEGSVMYYE
jgi:hypothetical protein